MDLTLQQTLLSTFMPFVFGACEIQMSTYQLKQDVFVNCQIVLKLSLDLLMPW